MGADGNPEELISLGDISKLWNCSRTTVARRLRSGEVQAIKFGTSRNSMVRYLRADVEAYLKSQFDNRVS